jgi:hypothetical protein
VLTTSLSVDITRLLLLRGQCPGSYSIRVPCFVCTRERVQHSSKDSRHDTHLPSRSLAVLLYRTMSRSLHLYPPLVDAAISASSPDGKWSVPFAGCCSALKHDARVARNEGSTLPKRDRAGRKALFASPSIIVVILDDTLAINPTSLNLITTGFAICHPLLSL